MDSLVKSNQFEQFRLRTESKHGYDFSPWAQTFAEIRKLIKSSPYDRVECPKCPGTAFSTEYKLKVHIEEEHFDQICHKP